MKKLYFLIIVIFFFSNCKKSLNSVTSRKEEKTQKLNQLLEEYQSDEIQKLTKEFNNYLLAFSNGDSETILNYMYPSIFEYMKNQHSELNSIEEVKLLFTQTFTELKKGLKETKENGFSHKLEIGNIEKIAENGNFRIYYVTSFSKLNKNSNSKTFAGKQIAISDDYGKNWSFLEKDANKKYIEILKKDLPNKLLKEIK